MAEATRTQTIVSTTETRFTLDLSEVEYNYLRGLLGSQNWGDGDGASRRIWDALDEPKEAPAEPDTFQEGDTVTVLPGAKSANGSNVGWLGAATVSRGIDTDGDYTVRQSGDDYGYDYVLPQYLTRR